MLFRLVEDYIVEMYPHKGERKKEFISRFMSDEDMMREFPDNKQRFAVCMSYWERREKHRRKINK